MYTQSNSIFAHRPSLSYCLFHFVTGCGKSGRFVGIKRLLRETRNATLEETQRNAVTRWSGMMRPDERNFYIFVADGVREKRRERMRERQGERDGGIKKLLQRGGARCDAHEYLSLSLSLSLCVRSLCMPAVPVLSTSI